MNKKNTCKFIKSKLAKLQPSSKPYFVYDEEGNGLRMRIAPSGTKSFQVMKRIGGKTTFVTLGKFCDLKGGMIMHPELAQKKARCVYAELIDGVDVNEKKREERKEKERIKNTTLGAFLTNHYERWSRVNHKDSKGNLKIIESHFSKWYDTPMADISPAMVDRWRDEQLGKGRKPSGINRKVTALRGVMSRAVDADMLDTHPLAKLKQLKVDKNPKPRYLTDGEKKRLLGALDERQETHRKRRSTYNQWLTERGRNTLADADMPFTDYLKPMVLTALHTGLRRGELFNLTWDDINFEKKALTVIGSGSKSGHTRHIPLGKLALSTLVTWRDQTGGYDLVFPNPKTGLRFDNIKSSWKAVLKKADLVYPKDHPKRFTFHDLRHCYASNLVMNGISLYVVKELLGHDSVETTQIYAHLTPDHMANVIAVLDDSL